MLGYTIIITGWVGEINEDIGSPFLVHSTTYGRVSYGAQQVGRW